ncbi:hypothetical protein NLX83_09895 [Allokutzneria sp. A3M-2-11 16]|uniref:hypothetical protein n=1 Tax=Allokutzneria sp. A3M-2-11 16 TaxID=2962043 RepID=UPI0020B75E6B|nr:hypothetical protein [Allokutzneria sp. A3M-2-11 16]MCP3799567.1 hypothetical protein [Allokutzneria sp. A3M-2-11 16]
MTSGSRTGIVSLIAAGVIGVTAGVYAFAGQAAPPQISGDAPLMTIPGLVNHVQQPGAPIAPVLCADDDDPDDLDDLHDDDDDSNDPDDDLYDDDCD